MLFQVQLAEVCHGKRFILQGGDCAERFVDCTPSRIDAKLKILLQMSLVLVWGSRVPLVRIGRIAGQYMKPRSNSTEVRCCIFAQSLAPFDAKIYRLLKDMRFSPTRVIALTASTIWRSVSLIPSACVMRTSTAARQ